MVNAVALKAKFRRSLTRRAPSRLALLEVLESRCLLSVTFNSVQPYNTGVAPVDAITGDFRKDGRQDIAAINFTGNTLSILLNNGDGTYATQTTYATGNAPHGVVAGDFNGDGYLDVAVVNNNSNTVSIFLNKADGTGQFNNKVDYTTGSGPGAIVAADLNNDGKLDLAVTNNTSDTVSVLLNNGDGTFASKVDYATDTLPYSITAGDFNGDGKLDLAVVNNTSNTLSILRNNGNGTFATKVDYATGHSPFSVATGTFVSGGKPGIAVVNKVDNSVGVFINNGDGTFAAQVTYTTGATPYDVTAGDLNQDGLADLVVSNFGSGTVSVLLNNGNGTFATQSVFAAGNGPASVVISDLNSDGKPDLVTANYDDNQVGVLLQPLNHAPTDIQLSTSAVNEAQPVNTVVGTLTTTDADVGDAHTYTLVGGAGSSDNGSFTIVNNQLQTLASFNYATKNSYNIRIRTTDPFGLTFEKAFVISVVDLAPTDISLSNSSVSEGLPAGTSVGSFSTTAPASSTFTYALVSGAGSTDNASFTISAGQLLTAATFTYASQSSYSIRVQSTDAGGLVFQKVFVISVTDLPPTDISLSTSSVLNGTASGATVGSFTTTAPAPGTFTYTLVSGTGSADNASFTISGANLVAAATVSYASKTSYSIRVQSTDTTGASFQKSFVISVTPTPVPRYRLYNAGTKEHLYTTDQNEYNTLPNRGWTQEGAPYEIYNDPITLNGVAALPYYRLYNPTTFQHLWTTDANEKNTLSNGLGWNYEHVDGYIFPTTVTGGKALYRLYLPYNGVALHLWTTDVNEYNTLAATAGWSQEGLIGYVISNPG